MTSYDSTLGFANLSGDYGIVSPQVLKIKSVLQHNVVSTSIMPTPSNEISGDSDRSGEEEELVSRKDSLSLSLTLSRRKKKK